jgi:hypothetical protein
VLTYDESQISRQPLSHPRRFQADTAPQKPSITGMEQHPRRIHELVKDPNRIMAFHPARGKATHQGTNLRLRRPKRRLSYPCGNGPIQRFMQQFEQHRGIRYQLPTLQIGIPQPQGNSSHHSRLISKHVDIQ